MLCYGMTVSHSKIHTKLLSTVIKKQKNDTIYHNIYKKLVNAAIYPKFALYPKYIPNSLGIKIQFFQIWVIFWDI